MSKGYNPNRDPNGRFGAGAHKTAARVEHAHAKVASVGTQLHAANGARKAAVAEARSAIGSARRAAAKARAHPTPENVTAARQATAHATRAAAMAEHHRGEVARHREAHAKARTSAALAEGSHREAQRAAPAPLPRARQVEAHGVGFERVHGEADHPVQVHEPTPEFHFGAGMARIHGEGEHATVAQHQEPAPKPWSDQDRFAKREPPKQVPERKVMTQAESNAREHKRTADNERLRARDAQRVAEHRAVAPALESVPGVAAVSLPRAVVVKPRPSLLKRIFRRDSVPAIRAALSQARTAADYARQHPSAESKQAARAATRQARAVVAARMR